MKSKKQLRKLVLIIYLMAVAFILLVDRALEPVSEWSAEELIFISDMDSIDASRGSNSVYRIRLDGSGMRRIVGSIRPCRRVLLAHFRCRLSAVVAADSDRQRSAGSRWVSPCQARWRRFATDFGRRRARSLGYSAHCHRP